MLLGARHVRGSTKRQPCMLILGKMEEKHTLENRCLEVNRTLGLGAANYTTVYWIAEHIRVEMKRLFILLRTQVVHTGISFCV